MKSLHVLGAKTDPDVALRVHSFLGTITRDYRAKNVLVVSHSVVVLIFRRLLERWDEARYLQIDSDDVVNCSLTAYRYDPTASKLHSKLKAGQRDRGRDTSYLVPPARTRTSAY